VDSVPTVLCRCNCAVPCQQCHIDYVGYKLPKEDAAVSHRGSAFSHLNNQTFVLRMLHARSNIGHKFMQPTRCHRRLPFDTKSPLQLTDFLAFSSRTTSELDGVCQPCDVDVTCANSVKLTTCAICSFDLLLNMHVAALAGRTWRNASLNRPRPMLPIILHYIQID
jgi:hypothetical protein